MPRQVSRTAEEARVYMKDYRARRRDNGGPLRNPPTPPPYMTELVEKSWQRVARPDSKYEFVCYCWVCCGRRPRSRSDV